MEHFSEAEAQRIFAEAARARPAPPPDGGLSLDELREIGRAAGLDPDAVTAAAAALRDAPPDVPMWGRTPLATRCARVVPGRLSDDAWADTVADLRRTFKAQGVAETIGQKRTWTYAVGTMNEVVMARFMAEPAGDATRLTLESGDGTERQAVRILMPLLLGISTVLGSVAALTGDPVAASVLALILATCAVALYGLLRAVAVRRARTQPARFDAALDRVSRLVAAGAESDAPHGVVPLLDLPEGETPPDTDSVSPTRRTRA